MICADDLPMPERRRFISEQPGAIVVIERHAFVREVSDDDAWSSGTIVVRCIDAHSGACGAGRTERNTGGNAFICERAILVVVIKLVRFSVVRDEQIKPAVAVVIQQSYAQGSCQYGSSTPAF